MSEGRHIWAGLKLLDRQLLDHDGLSAGCCDDIELTAFADDNQLYASAILSGPGALAYRLGRRRLGRWLRRVHEQVSVGDDVDDTTRIPFDVVSDLGAAIKLGLGVEAVGSNSGERWTRDHIIGRIPGNGHAPE
jgi:hypothetical protein